MKTRKNIKIIALSGAAITALVTIPCAVIACSSNDNNQTTSITNSKGESLQNTINKYIETVNKTVLSTTKEVNSSTSVSQVNAQNINTYVSGIPATPAGVDVTYQISPDAYNGSISLVISASASGVSAQNSNPQTISGFQNATELFVLEANKVLDKLTPNKSGVSTLVTDLNPSNRDPKSIASLLNTSVLPSSAGLNITYIVNSVDASTGSVTFYMIVFQKGFSKQTNPVTISGFATPLLNQIKNLNLTPNANFAPPQNTGNFVPFSNSAPIFANFQMTKDQADFLASIKNLNIIVSNSSLTTGEATLTFFSNVNGNYNSIGQITYSNFFKGTYTAAQQSIQTYLKNNDNVASWLNSYLYINPSWLTNIFTNNWQSTSGIFFLGFNFSSSTASKIAFNNISVSNVNGVITINAIMPNAIQYQKWDDSTNRFVYGGETTANQSVTIQLPFIFQTNGDPKIQIVPSINTSTSGQTTIAWSIPSGGLSTFNYFFKLGDNNMAFRLGGNSHINSITF